MSPERMCIECGCTDFKACPGGCSWVVLHKATPTGICSNCWDRWLAGIKKRFTDEPVAELAGPRKAMYAR